MLDRAKAIEHALARLSTQKMQLFLSHLYLFPWFTRRFLSCGLPLQPFLDANPELQLGGLPIAPKLSRYGTEPPYLPSLTIDAGTERSRLESFAEEHPFPLIMKPLYGNHSRRVRRVFSVEELDAMTGEEPMIVQTYVDAPNEYGINLARIGPGVKIYGLTEITLRSVWGDGRRTLVELVESEFGEEAASRIDEKDWTPCCGRHVPVQTAADIGEGSVFRDITDQVTPPLRAACRDAADQIGLRFGRFDVKSESLGALKCGRFDVLEVNGSTSLDLTLYDSHHSLSVKIERLRAHWNQFFHQARPRESVEQNSWRNLSELLWFSVSPKQCAAHLGMKSMMANSLRVPNRNGGPQVADP